MVLNNKMKFGIFLNDLNPRVKQDAEQILNKIGEKKVKQE